MSYKDQGKNNQYQRDYRKAHPDRVRGYQRKMRKRLKFEVFEHYSTLGHPNCLHCGEDDIDVLCLDHISNGGVEHRKLTGTGSAFHWWLQKNDYPEGYQVLCANCNLKKEILRRRTKGRACGA